MFTESDVSAGVLVGGVMLLHLQPWVAALVAGGGVLVSFSVAEGILRWRARA